MDTLKYFIKRLKARDQALFGISINSLEWYFFEFHDSLKYQTIGTLAHCTKTELSTMKVLHFYNRKFNMRSYHSAKKECLSLNQRYEP